MIKQTLSAPSSVQICSRCLSHEVNSWINEKWADLDEKAKKEINEELATIKLKPGKCIVCDNQLISDGTTEKILRILEENNIPHKTKREFERFFVFGIVFK